MSLLVEYLADYVQEEFEKQYGPSLEELRLNLTGVPKELREKLFEFLSSDSRILTLKRRACGILFLFIFLMKILRTPRLPGNCKVL